MKARKVIPLKCLPSRPPVFKTVVVWIALDHWHAPQWLYGAVGLLFILLWCAAIHGWATQEEVDIFKEEKK